MTAAKPRTRLGVESLESRITPDYGYMGTDGLTDSNVFFDTTGFETNAALQSESAFFNPIAAAQQNAQVQMERSAQTSAVAYQQNFDRAVESIQTVEEQKNNVIANAGQQLEASNQQLSAQSQAMIDSLTRRMEADGRSKEEINKKVQEVIQNATNAVGALQPGTTPDSPQVQEIMGAAQQEMRNIQHEADARSAAFAAQIAEVKKGYDELMVKFTAQQKEIIRTAIGQYEQLQAAENAIAIGWQAQNEQIRAAAEREYNAIAQNLNEQIRQANEAIAAARQAQADADAQKAEQERQRLQQFNQFQAPLPEPQSYNILPSTSDSSYSTDPSTNYTRRVTFDDDAPRLGG